MTLVGPPAKRLRAKGGAWPSGSFRPRLSSEELRLLKEVAEEGETPQQALRRALRLAADRAAVLRRLDELERRLAGLAPPTAPPSPPRAATDPVAQAARAILRWQRGEEEAE